MVAKAPAPATRPPPSRAKPPRAAKKKAASKPKPALPASVTMAADRVVRGEALPVELESEGATLGVIYRLVVADANGRPVAPGSYKIRKHLLHVASSGCLAREEVGAQISVVPLDADGASFDFLGVPVVTERPLEEGESRDATDDRKGAREVGSSSLIGAPRTPASGKDEVFEYFSFELQGVSYAIPQSGFVLSRSLRGHRATISRSPRAGGSIHGAVVQGFVTEGGGDSFAFEIVAPPSKRC